MKQTVLATGTRIHLHLYKVASTVIHKCCLMGAGVLGHTEQICSNKAISTI